MFSILEELMKDIVYKEEISSVTSTLVKHSSGLPVPLKNWKKLARALMLQKTIKKVICGIVCGIVSCRYDLVLISLLQWSTEAVIKQMKGNEAVTRVKTMLKMHMDKKLVKGLQKLGGSEEEAEIKVLPFLISYIHDNAFDIDRQITSKHVSKLAVDLVKKLFKENNTAKQILKTAVYIRKLTSGGASAEIDVGADCSELFKGDLHDLSRLIPDQNARLLVDALCALLRKDPETGEMKPDLEKIKPLALVLGGFDEEKLDGIIDLISKLQVVYGGTSSMMELLDGKNDMKLADQVAQQLASQALGAKTIRLQNVKDLFNSKTLSYDEFVRGLFQFIDVDGNGNITFDEFHELLTQMRLNISREHAAILFAKFDMDGAGCITALEFETGFRHIEDVMVNMALETLGLTRKELYSILLWGIFVLVLLSIFIFFGVSAFNTGTQFGSVVNSVLPLVASTAMFQGDVREKITEKASAIKNAALKALKKMRVKSAV